jgi:hypothetical protein
MANISPTTEQTVNCVAPSIDTIGVTMYETGRSVATQAVLPAGYAITEIYAKRSSTASLAPDGGQSITVGVAGSVATFSVASLNSSVWVGSHFTTLVATGADAPIKATASVGNITAGTLNVTIKYKPYPDASRKY